MMEAPAPRGRVGVAAIREADVAWEAEMEGWCTDMRAPGKGRGLHCGKPAQYSGGMGDRLCDDHALERVWGHGLQALSPGDRARFLGDHPGYAGGGLLYADFGPG